MRQIVHCWIVVSKQFWMEYVMGKILDSDSNNSVLDEALTITPNVPKLRMGAGVLPFFQVGATAPQSICVCPCKKALNKIRWTFIGPKMGKFALNHEAPSSILHCWIQCQFNVLHLVESRIKMLTNSNDSFKPLAVSPGVFFLLHGEFRRVALQSSWLGAYFYGE